MECRVLLVMISVLLGHLSAEVKEPDWDSLVEFGKRHGLLFPPREAKLVLAHSETWSVVGNRSHPHDPANYHPAWLIEELGDGSIRVLSGLEESVLKPREEREPLWRVFSMDEPKPAIGGHCADTGGTLGFIAAVACAERGDIKQAGVFWDRLAKEDWIRDRRGELMLVSDSDLPRRILSILIWDGLERSISEANSDLSGIEKRMKALFDEVPKLATDSRRQIFEKIRLTNSAPLAKEGSLEALLIEHGKSHHWILDELFQAGWDEPRGKILRMGFDAVPELIRLSDDPRLTSQRWEAVMMGESSPKSLGDLARGFLAELIGPKQRHMMDPARGDFAGGWEKIRDEPELDYFERTAWVLDAESSSFSEAALAVLADKAPERLVELQTRYLLEADEDDLPWDLCEALTVARLPQKAKLSCLQRLASEGGIARRRAATQVLAGFDGEAAKIPARALMMMLPTDAKGAYWTSAEGGASHVALAVDDDEVWQTFLAKARNAEVGLRLEWMNPFDYLYVGDRLKGRRLAFLAAFLDDPAVRDETIRKEMYEGPCAGFTFPEITVRDFAAMQIASILKIDRLNPPDATWDAARWSKYRGNVAKRLEEEGIEPMVTGRE